MRPVWQTVGGPAGNCYAACVASILEINVCDVPQFGPYWTADLRRFLHSRSLTAQFQQDGPAPPGYSIAGQRTPLGPIHSVVCLDGQLVHDPSVRPIGSPDYPVALWTSFEDINAAPIFK